MSRTMNMLLFRIFTGIILAGFYMTANIASAATPTPKFDGTTYSSMKQNGRTIVVDGHLNTFVQKDGNVYEYIGTIDPATMNKSDPKPANQTKSDKSGTASQKSAEQHITKSTLYKNVELNNLDQAKRLIQHDYRAQIDLGSCVKKTNVWIGGKYQDTLTCDDKINGGKIQFEFDDLSEKKNALNETVYQKLQNYLCKKVDKNLTYEDDTCMKDLETIWGSNVPRKPSKGKYPKSVDVFIPVTKAGAKEYVENYQKNKDMNLTYCKTNVEEHNIVCTTPDKTKVTFEFNKEFIDLDYFKDMSADSQRTAQDMVREKYSDCTGTGWGINRPNIITCTMWGGKNNKQKFEFEFEFKKIEQAEDESEEAEEDEEEEETLGTPEESEDSSEDFYKKFETLCAKQNTTFAGTYKDNECHMVYQKNSISFDDVKPTNNKVIKKSFSGDYITCDQPSYATNQIWRSLCHDESGHYVSIVFDYEDRQITCDDDFEFNYATGKCEKDDVLKTPVLESEPEVEVEEEQQVDAEQVKEQLEADARTILDAYEEKMTELNEKYHQ